MEPAKPEYTAINEVIKHGMLMRCGACDHAAVCALFSCRHLAFSSLIRTETNAFRGDAQKPRYYVLLRQ